MNFQQVQYALAVAHYKNFSAAAKNLYISQPALSLQIQKLEKELGISLFKRHARGITLTAESEIFFRDAQQVEAAWQQLVFDMRQQEKKSTLRIAYSVRLYASGLYDHLLAYENNNTATEFIHFSNSDRNNFDSLLKKEIDVVLDRLPSTYKIENLENLFSCELLTEPQCALVSPNDVRFQDQEQMLFSQLTGYPIISALKGGYFDCAVSSLLNKYDIQPSKIYRCENSNMRLDMVKRGVGYTLGPPSLARHYGLRAVYLEPRIMLSLNFVCRKESLQDQQIVALRDYLISFRNTGLDTCKLE